ncbi:MAG: outer membrane beta-barrel domain-containing protein [Candidatus Riflebacteria bacterium]|nr:outer membrane beta-barrel domain-containing protein [Candidatus Riflebacteria bacterium]
MKLTKWDVLLIAVIALLVPGGPVWAAGTDPSEDPARQYGREKAWEVSPFVGRAFFDKKHNLEDSSVYGGRLGYNVSKRITVEGTVEKIKSRVDDKLRTGTGKGQYRSPTDRVDLTLYHLDVLYHLQPGRKLAPYVVAGVGATHFRPSLSNKDMATVDFGVGAKYWLSRDLALRADLRDHMVSEVFQNGFHNYSATVELVFAFGGPSKAPAAPPPPVPEQEVILVSEWPLPEVENKVRRVVKTPRTEPRVLVLAFEDVHFAFDQSSLNKEAKAILDRSIRILQANPDIKVNIAGYTSASGSDAYNQSLSERRARAVEDYLVRTGLVAADRLSTIGYGEHRPAAHEAAPKDLYSKAAHANMRVLFETLVQ